MDADPTQLVPAAKSGLGLQGNHEGYLKALVAVQNELEGAVTSPGGGTAIQNAMFSAWQKGNVLSQALHEIMTELLNSANRIDGADQEIAAQIKSMNEYAASHGAQSFGTDGVNSNAGDMSGVNKINILF